MGSAVWARRAALIAGVRWLVHRRKKPDNMTGVLVELEA